MKIKTINRLTKLGNRLVIIAFLFWLAETAFFGWNKTPQSSAERVCDYLALIILVIGWVIQVLASTRRQNKKDELLCAYLLIARLAKATQNQTLEWNQLASEVEAKFMELEPELHKSVDIH